MNICLIGFKGSGKSTVGRLVAQRLSWAFVDLDRQLEEQERQENGSDLTAREIYSRLGEIKFRALELQVLRDVLQRDRQVVSLGGGTPCAGSVVQDLLNGHQVIYLTASVEILYGRMIAQGMPAFLDPHDPFAAFLRLWGEREPLYRAVAKGVVDTSGLGVAEVVEEVLAAVAGTIAMIPSGGAIADRSSEGGEDAR